MFLLLATLLARAGDAPAEEDVPRAPEAEEEAPEPAPETEPATSEPPLADLVVWTEQKWPDYPQAALDQDLGPLDCRLRLLIDETGRVTRVEVKRCPEPFLASATEAVLAWRALPVRLEDGTPRKAQYLLNVKFIQGKPGQTPRRRRGSR